LRDNVNTDAIIPAEWLRSVHADHGQGLFGRWRYDEDGREIPEFLLNQPRFRDARILIAGRNFGCGSSRENAVWALLTYGIRCVIAPSFGDIFRENSTKNGLLAVRLADELVARLAEEISGIDGAAEMTVDLVAKRIRTSTGRVVPFDIDAQVREFLMAGMDEIDRTLAHRQTIVSFQERDLEARPWTYPPWAGDG
jgi:3-isopropylmalate/(R)-2-methylmalate dehydratase small subunit